MNITFWLSSLVTIVACINDVIGVGDHCAVLKSIRSTDVECQQYLNGSTSGKCGVRCRGLIDRFWNDSVGLDQSIKRFYQPHPEDGCFRNRTTRCLKQIMETVPRDDLCSLAQENVQCYNDQYGELNVDGVLFIPFTPMQLTQILMDCASLLGVSESVLKAVEQDGIGSVPQGACLLRCFLLRLGLYTDVDGFNWQRMDVQCGGYGSHWNQSAVQDCISHLDEFDICEKAYRGAEECLKLHFRVRFQVSSCFMPFSVEFYAGLKVGFLTKEDKLKILASIY